VLQPAPMSLPEHFQELSLASSAGGGLTDPNARGRPLSLSPTSAVRSFLSSIAVDVDRLLRPEEPYVVPPKLDTSHKLVDYYISSSHNTYLSANQLIGRSDASAYASVVRAPPPFPSGPSVVCQADVCSSARL
jgi:hypothetical protein